MGVNSGSELFKIAQKSGLYNPIQGPASTVIISLFFTIIMEAGTSFYHERVAEKECRARKKKMFKNNKKKLPNKNDRSCRKQDDVI